MDYLQFLSVLTIMRKKSMTEIEGWMVPLILHLGQLRMQRMEDCIQLFRRL